MDTRFVGTKLSEAARTRKPMTASEEDAYYRRHEGRSPAGLAVRASGILRRAVAGAIRRLRRSSRQALAG